MSPDAAVGHALAGTLSVGEEGERRAFLLNAALLGSIAILAAIDGSLLYCSVTEGASYGGVSFAGFSVLPAFLLFLYALSRRGFAALASYLFVGVYAGSIGYAAYGWGADLETTILSLVLVAIIASILLGAKFGVLAAAAGAAVVPLWYAQWHHILPAFREQAPNIAIAITAAALYCLIVFVVWRANRRTESSLSRALESESKLRGQLRQNELEKIGQLYQFAEFGRLSSGLFHDLLNLMNAAALQGDSALAADVQGTAEDARARSAAAEDKLANALRVNRRIERFTQAIRRQLASEETHETFSLVEAIGQAADLLSYKANKAGVRISFEHDAADALLWSGNPFKFHQVAMNLLANAIESYDEGPARGAAPRAVSVVAERRGADFVIAVRDDGCGVPPALREKIFEPFFTTKSASRGMGIGLAITKQIAENDLQGTITVASEPGKGSAFTVAFPMMAPSEGIEPP